MKDQGPDNILNITCTHNLAGDVFGVIRVFRQVDDDGAIHETIVAENSEVKKMYADTDRYQVKYSMDKTTGDTTTTITIQGMCIYINTCKFNYYIFSQNW